MRLKFFGLLAGAAAISYLGAASCVAIAGAATSKSAPAKTLSVSIDDRPIDAAGEYAIRRGGVIYGDLVDLTRAVGGIIMYRNADGAEVDLNHKHLAFTTNSTTAKLDGVPILLAGAPFLHYGQLFVPLRTLAITAGFAVRYDASQAHINLGLPQVSVNPSPVASQVSVTTSYSVAADGLHLIASIQNLTGAPLTLNFPTGARASFLATREGGTLWDSTSGLRVLETKSKLTFEPHETKSFASFWPGYLRAGLGPITLRARLLCTPPVDAPGITVAGIALPSPSPAPSAEASSAPMKSPVPSPMVTR